MGHKEDLLAGAKRCLLEKGYARTTARDIVAASGTNLASIGYHYGSKEALLNAALFEALDEMSEEWIKPLLEDAGQGLSQLERFERYWTAILETLPTHRNLWAATFDLWGQLEHMPQLRAQAIAGYEDGRKGWALLLCDIDPDAEPERARAVGTFHMGLMIGVVAQCLVDPAHAPAARDLALALQTVAAGITAPAPAP